MPNPAASGAEAADTKSASHRALLPLLREIGDLKRVRSAGRQGSIAERAFRSAWAALDAGATPDEVAFATTAACLAATRLADLDADAMGALGLGREEALAVGRAGLAGQARLLPPGLRERLRDALWSLPLAVGPALPFVDALADQPRAGVTSPEQPRIVLLPAENHAEHCLAVAVYAVLLAEDGADLGRAFLAGLAHHLHNALMPDAGYTGEMLLGDHLGPVMDRATTLALDELAPPLRARVEQARAVLPDAGTPEGRAFHAADVLDRVLEIEQHLVRSRLTLTGILAETELVHDSPVSRLHESVLAEMGLA